VAEPLVDWAIASRTRPGELVAGDLALVSHGSAGALIATADGLGHGPAAARAARAAVREAVASLDGDVAAIARRCHRALRQTRGAALSLGLVARATQTVTWLGVGNVEGRVIHRRPHHPAPPQSLTLSPGVPGHDLPELVPEVLPLGRGDLLIFATDGIDRCFADDLDVSGTPAQIAERIVRRHWTARDDALSLVVRSLGAAR
jgi:phosphoserine phosphatase RsbX